MWNGPLQVQTLGYHSYSPFSLIWVWAIFAMKSWQKRLGTQSWSRHTLKDWQRKAERRRAFSFLFLFELKTVCYFLPLCLHTPLSIGVWSKVPIKYTDAEDFAVIKNMKHFTGHECAAGASISVKPFPKRTYLFSWQNIATSASVISVHSPANNLLGSSRPVWSAKRSSTLLGWKVMQPGTTASQK